MKALKVLSRLLRVGRRARAKSSESCPRTDDRGGIVVFLDKVLLDRREVR